MKKVGIIYQTKEYRMFKKLIGNRRLTELRVQKIIRSINSVGYIPSPIIVNEKHEVIDGQGRLEACTRLSLPVYFAIVPGIGKKECTAMNIGQTNWTLVDFIESYADLGNISYVYLLQLINGFKKDFPNKTIFYAVTGKIDNVKGIIKNGDFVISEEEYTYAMQSLTWLRLFRDIISRIEGHTEFYYTALLYCYRDEEVENDRLLEKIQLLQANLIPVTTMQQALEQIETAYNHRTRNKVYIKTNYRKFMDGRYAWYENRYGHKYENNRGAE